MVPRSLVWFHATVDGAKKGLICMIERSDIALEKRHTSMTI
jgi:hypothetical protein